MPWQVSFNVKLDVIECTFTGTVTAAELGAGINEVLRLAAQLGKARCLTDCTRLKPGGHSIFDLYQQASAIITGGIPPDAREAVLPPDNPAVAAQFEFWENVCHNRGLNVKTFRDRPAALAWLAA